MLKKIASLLLCLVFAASALLMVSCGGSEDTSDGSIDVSGETEGFLNPEKNWEGQTVNILTWKEDAHHFTHCQIDAAELEDESVNDAFYERNAFIQEKYGIDIVACHAPEGKDYIQMLRDDIISGNNEFDAICAAITYVAPLGIEGQLYDFNALNNSYLHLDKEWWDQPLMTDTAINGSVYMISGDAIVEDDEATWAIFFNKDLVKSYGIEDPYQLVRDDKWTFDKMHELCSQVELTHGATKSYDPAVGDQWGMVMQSYDILMFMQGGEQTMVDNTGDVPVFRIDDQRNIQVFTNLTNFIYDEKNVGIADRHGHWEVMYTNEGKIFENGNALFMPNSISLVSSPGIRDAEIHYGILPMPKADELQEEYTTSINVYHYGVFAIPISNVEKLDVTCYALEAMAYYGKERVTPEYYDRTLTYKRFTDDESREMLDLIFRNRTYDLSTIFNFGGGSGSLYFYTALIGNLSTDIVSQYESKSSMYETGLQELIDQCY
ncbi:MAG: carbohydrate ABC transporter substrate-binding protein [Ruminococcaceae bacterium]|nr:carbohydrate ABC transporter substrate-binding protein [Oscillospiraceae bacterium]